jgi:hypothetical protein
LIKIIFARNDLTPAHIKSPEKCSFRAIPNPEQAHTRPTPNPHQIHIMCGVGVGFLWDWYGPVLVFFAKETDSGQGLAGFCQNCITIHTA